MKPSKPTGVSALYAPLAITPWRSVFFRLPLHAADGTWNDKSARDIVQRVAKTVGLPRRQTRVVWRYRQGITGWLRIYRGSTPTAVERRRARRAQALVDAELQRLPKERFVMYAGPTTYNAGRGASL